MNFNFISKHFVVHFVSYFPYFDVNNFPNFIASCSNLVELLWHLHLQEVTKSCRSCYMLFVNVSITVYPEGGSTSQGEVEKKKQAEDARTIGLSSSFLISHRWRYFSERTTEEGSGRSWAAKEDHGARGRYSRFESIPQCRVWSYQGSEWSMCRGSCCGSWIRNRCDHEAWREERADNDSKEYRIVG